MIDLLLAATLTFTMPSVHSDGSPLPQGYTRYEVAYGTQSRTWRDSSAVMLADTASWNRNWPAVVAEAAPVVVASGWARTGEVVSISAPPVVSLYWPFTYFVWAVSSGVVRGPLSNAVSRASNDSSLGTTPAVEK